MNMFTIFAGYGEEIIPDPSSAKLAVILLLLLFFASIPPLISTFIYKKAVGANKNLSKLSDKSFLVFFGLLYFLAIPVLWAEWKTDSIHIYPFFILVAVISIYFVIKKLNSNK